MTTTTTKHTPSAFENALLAKREIETKVENASKCLNTYCATYRRPNGSLPDSVKSHILYQDLLSEYRAAFSNLRAFNTSFMRVFGKQYRAAIRRATGEE